MPGKSQLLLGDNLRILQSGVFSSNTFDCIYLDPPFNSKKKYNFRPDGQEKVTAFVDSWTWNPATEKIYQKNLREYDHLKKMMHGLEVLCGPSPMLAYLMMMAPRLDELKRILKADGNIFLHCNPSASHYLKIMMDFIFDNNFINEIVWCYSTGGRSKASFPSKHDVVLRYSKTRKARFYYQNICLPRNPLTMHETVLRDERGGLYQKNCKNGKEYRYYLDKGVIPNDWWADIQALNPSAKERSGYPTQKPEALLERIIKSCTLEGDLVMDPFCGGGTTISVCERLKRRWVGIDVSSVAISVARQRLLPTNPHHASANHLA